MIEQKVEKRIVLHVLKLSLLLVATCMFTNLIAQTNLNFESGLKGWTTTGNAGNIMLVENNAHAGTNSVEMGEGLGTISQNVEVFPFAIVQFKAWVKSSNSPVTSHSFIRFYNASDSLLLALNSKPLSSTVYESTGNYTLAPPYSKYLAIGIEKDIVAGSVYADDFSIEISNNETTRKVAAYDAAQYMVPFWNADTINNETVLLYSANGQPATGRLLYTPSKILLVKSFDLKNTYRKRKDYNVQDNVITRSLKSKMPFRADTSFDRKNNLAWFDLQSQWVVVTYKHKDKWTGPTPVYKGDNMPNTISTLTSKLPLSIVAYGMSITRGMNVSGFDSVPPYMPSYVELFASGLKKHYNYDDIAMYNAGLPGAVVDWGAQYADTYIAPLKPDLVIIDFGMNDFWRYTPEQFKGYIDTIMIKSKIGNPGVEFLLVSNMKFDPDYILDSDPNKTFYTSNMEGYNTVLQQLETRGVINLDITTLSGEIYQKKKAKDCIANPLHPNDYLARWYAQGMVKLFQK